MFIKKKTNMKKILVVAIALIALFGCNNSKSEKELMSKTDYFVESLQTTYQSYGMQGIENALYTSDGNYQIIPIGRLINVKIMNSDYDKSYTELKETLTKHYKGDFRVNDVYICNAGTIMIDCRN